MILIELCEFRPNRECRLFHCKELFPRIHFWSTAILSQEYFIALPVAWVFNPITALYGLKLLLAPRNIPLAYFCHFWASLFVRIFCILSRRFLCLISRYATVLIFLLIVEYSSDSSFTKHIWGLQFLYSPEKSMLFI